MTFSDPTSGVKYLFCCITNESLVQPSLKGRRHRSHLWMERESRMCRHVLKSPKRVNIYREGILTRAVRHSNI